MAPHEPPHPPGNGPFRGRDYRTNRPRGLVRAAEAPWISREWLGDAFARQRGSIWLKLHLATACLFLFLAAGPTSLVEFAGIPLMLCFLLRSRTTWRFWPLVLAQPQILLGFAIAGWMAVSLLWSGRPGQGLEEMGSMRWAWAVLVLYPVLQYRPVLILSLAAGFLAGNLGQAVHALQPVLGVQLWARDPMRVSGWWDPVVGGTLLTGILGLHLPAAVRGRGRARLVGFAGALATGIAIVATGTRGAWLAGAGLVVIALVWGWLRGRGERLAGGPVKARSGGGGRRKVALVLVMAAAGVLAWVAVGDRAASRARAGWDEVASAVSRGEFGTDTGARLLVNWWAVEAAMRRPIHGVGAGGFRAWAIERLTEQGIDPAARPLLPHAHNAPLHIAATLGLVGIGFWAALVLIVLRAAFRAGSWGGGASPRGTEAAGGLWADQADAYRFGPAFGLIGLLFVSAFDVVHINAQTSALLWILIALCPAVPPPRPGAERTGAPAGRSEGTQP